MLAFYRSLIGKKIIVAFSGLLLFGFVVGHLLGNLQVFAGPDKINDYAQFLRDNPPLVWGTRIVLLIAVFFHILATIQLVRLNRASRPIAYKKHEIVQANLSSRIMIVSGLGLGLFIIYHILHMTTGALHHDFSHHDIYSNMGGAFSIWWVTLIYVSAMAALGYHLYHGVWSVFQTLGLNHPKYNFWRRVIAVGSAVTLAIGYIAIPVAVYVGVLR